MKKFHFSSFFCHTLLFSTFLTKKRLFFCSLLLVGGMMSSVHAQGVCVTISQPDLLALTCDKTDITIPNGSNGIVTVTATGGTIPYNYLWSDGSTTATISNLAAGTYEVTVTDAHGCDQICSSTVSAPGCMLDLTLAVAAAPCQTTVLTSSVTGATGAVTYLWSSGETTASLMPILIGDYTLTVTDAASCQISKMYTVTLVPPPTIMCTATATSLVGSADGTASVVGSGGHSPYTYSWSNNETTATINVLNAGTYTVTVTDASSCTATCDATVYPPTCTLDLQIAIAAEPCQGTVLSGTTTGETGAVSYLWSNGETTPTILPTLVGDYTLTVTDALNCEATKTYTVSLLPAPTVNCAGNSGGHGEVNVSGGIAPYTYLWSNNATTASINVSSDGNYAVTVTDASGCTATCTTPISVPGCSLSATTLASAFACHGGTTGSAEVMVSGASGTINYLWSNNATTKQINNLTAGTYMVTATNGSCTITATAEITEPPALVVTCSKTDVTTTGGSNGSASVAVTGGTSPYTYLWSNNATTPTLSNLSAGTYSITVTDTINCPSVVCSLMIIAPPCPSKICLPVMVTRL
jgi:SprB repeat